MKGLSCVAAADDERVFGGAAEHCLRECWADAALKDEALVVKSTAQIHILCCCLLL
jgi:hypothetical protein